MSTTSPSAKRFGLLLQLPGAPNEPHRVEGWPGLFRPDIPTPVEPDKLTAVRDRLKAFDAGVDAAATAWDEHEVEQVARDLRPAGPLTFERPVAPLTLVEIKAKDLELAETTAAASRIAARNGVIAARKAAESIKKPPVADIEAIEQETKAIKEAS